MKKDLRLKMPQFREMYLNKRITYIKKGEKFGWKGVVVDVYQKGGCRVLVRYDNCLEQDYRIDALHQMQKSWGGWPTYLALDNEHHRERLEWLLSSESPAFSSGRKLHKHDRLQMIEISKQALKNKV